MANLATAYVQIVPTMKGVKNNLENMLDGVGGAAGSSSGKTFAAKFGSAAKGALGFAGKAALAGVTAAAGAAAAVAKNAIDNYADFEQLSGGIETLFGDSAAAVMRNADRAFQSAGMSANEYMETVTSFSASLINSLGGDTAEAAKLANRAIQDMSDNANTFGTDIQSIQNAYQGFAKGQYTMLDNLKLGYGGTKTEMERLITDAEKLNKNFKAQRDTNGNLALSFDDIVNAIGIVQDKMNITGTTAREASGTISGSIDTMKSAFQNFVTGLGMNNADIDMLLGNLVQAFQNVVTNIQPIIERLIEYIPGVVAAVIPVLEGMAPDLIRTAVELFNAFINAMIDVLPDIIPVAIEAINLLANTLIQNLPTIIEAGIQLIIGLISGFAEALPTLMAQAPKLISTLANAIINNLPTIITAGIKIIQALIEGLISMAGNLPQIAYDILVSIKDTFAGGVEAAWGWGRDLIINFANGIIEHTKAVWSSVKNVAQSIWDLLHFSEPDTGPLKDFHTYAPDMMRTFAEGITKNAHLVSDAASQAMGGVATAMQNGSATSNAYNFGGFNIAVYQQPGESTDELVDRLMYQMQNRMDARRTVFA